MTTVYVPNAAEGFELCQPEAATDFVTLNHQIDGCMRQATWQPIPMRLVHVDEGRHLSHSDSPWLGSHALIFRRSAIEKMGALLHAHGELLPLSCAEAELFVFNATRVVDALDEQASSLQRFSSGRILRITRYAFHSRPLGAVDLFKIPNLRISPTFVSERFVQLWMSTGLCGLHFAEAWTTST